MEPRQLELKTETKSGSDLAPKFDEKIDFPLGENAEEGNSTLEAKTTQPAAAADSFDWTRSSGIKVSDDDAKAEELVSPKPDFVERVDETWTKTFDEPATTSKTVSRKSSFQGFRYKMQELMMRKKKKEEEEDRKRKQQRINQMIPATDPIKTSKVHFLVIQIFFRVMMISRILKSAGKKSFVSNFLKWLFFLLKVCFQKNP